MFNNKGSYSITEVPLSCKIMQSTVANPRQNADASLTFQQFKALPNPSLATPSKCKKCH